MDKIKLANSLSRIENLIPTKPIDIKKSQAESLGETKEGSFEKTLDEILDAKPDGIEAKGVANKKSDTVSLASSQNPLPANLKFSNHAIERMQSRGISYGPESMRKLDEAIKKAAAKGSRDTLVLMDESALIVSVKNNTVVTVMDKNALKENVFTNIDSTVVI